MRDKAGAVWRNLGKRPRRQGISDQGITMGTDREAVFANYGLAEGGPSLHLGWLEGLLRLLPTGDQQQNNHLLLLFLLSSKKKKTAMSLPAGSCGEKQFLSGTQILLRRGFQLEGWGGVEQPETGKNGGGCRLAKTDRFWPMG